MKKAFLFTVVPLLLMFVFTGCDEHNPEELIPNISGYWQIEEVTFADGRKKAYNFSENIDYIKIGDSLNGFRKKLQPRLDGTFKATASLEEFKLKIENDSLKIYYSTPFSNWKETILEANESKLLILNSRGDIYLYKHYEPIDLN